MLRNVACCLCLLFIVFVCQMESLAAPPRLRAKSAVLLNATNGKILYAKNPNRPIQPASLTKILTLYLVHEAVSEGKINLSDKATISMEAYLTGGSSMYLEEGSDVELEDLIKGIAIVSANDASVAVAEHLGGDVAHFVKMMNTKARALGMNHSKFINPNGLPAKGQVSTALDFAKLARSYIRNFPDSLNIHAMKSFKYRDITQNNRNDLLRQYPDADGLKTGFVRSAGFHLIATAKRGDTRLIAVLMGERNRAIRSREASRLLDQGFKMTKDGYACRRLCKEINS